jgi:hypothetical protein
MLVIIYRKLKSFKGNYLLCYWEALLKTICEYKIVEKAKMLSGNLVEKEILNVYQVFWCFYHCLLPPKCLFDYQKRT